MKIRCCWCGWVGKEEDLDMNEHDDPAYCPVCGHSDFDKRFIARFMTTRFLKKDGKDERIYKNDTRLSGID